MKSSFPKEVRSRSPRSTQFSQPTASIDLIASIAPLQQRSEREARGQFLLEGQRAVRLALETDCLETLIFDAQAPFALRELVKAARNRGVHCTPVEAHFLLQLACGEDPQGVIGVAARRTLSLGEAFAEGGVWVALESVQKPGNLGSILRTAEAAGARGVIAVGAQIDFFDPLVVRASMGAFFAQKLVRASWNQAQTFKFRHDLTWLATSPEASTPYDQAHFPRDFWLWMGDERRGLTSRTLEICDEKLSIPMQGRVDSLNLGVATGIVLFGARRKSGEREA